MGCCAFLWAVGWGGWELVWWLLRGGCGKWCWCGDVDLVVAVVVRVAILGFFFGFVFEPWCC